MNFDKNIKYIKKAIKKYFRVHTDFTYKEIGSAIKYVNKWEEQKFIIDNADDYYLLQKFNKNLIQIQDCVDKMFSKINIFNILNEYIDNYKADIQYERDYYVDKIESISSYKHSVHTKICSLYGKETSLIDLIFDQQFIVVYVIKILFFLLLVISLNISETLFSALYSKYVFEKNIPPPSIYIYILIFFIVHLIAVIFIIVFLSILMFLFDSPSNKFIIDIFLIKKVIIDYIFCISLFLIFTIIIGAFIQNKKYFRYNSEGMRGIRALKGISILFGSIIFILPFYAIF